MIRNPLKELLLLLICMGVVSAGDSPTGFVLLQDCVGVPPGEDHAKITELQLEEGNRRWLLTGQEPPTVSGNRVSHALPANTTIKVVKQDNVIQLKTDIRGWNFPGATSLSIDMGTVVVSCINKKERAMKQLWSQPINSYDFSEGEATPEAPSKIPSAPLSTSSSNTPNVTEVPAAAEASSVTEDTNETEAPDETLYPNVSTRALEVALSGTISPTDTISGRATLVSNPNSSQSQLSWTATTENANETKAFRADDTESTVVQTVLPTEVVSSLTGAANISEMDKSVDEDTKTILPPEIDFSLTASPVEAISESEAPLTMPEITTTTVKEQTKPLHSSDASIPSTGDVPLTANKTDLIHSTEESKLSNVLAKEPESFQDMLNDKAKLPYFIGGGAAILLLLMALATIIIRNIVQKRKVRRYSGNNEELFVNGMQNRPPSSSAGQSNLAIMMYSAGDPEVNDFAMEERIMSNETASQDPQVPKCLL